MFDYKIVKIMIKGTFTRVPAEEYHQIIIDHGRLGYRLAHIFAPPLYTQGMADYIELIFEREY